MIVAISDDFTGAAELGGIGLRYGLDVEIHTEVPDSTRAELLIIATDTRAVSAEEAFDEISKIVSKLHLESLQSFFKKTDSVLRGHIITELKAIEQALDEEKVILVPCNPSLSRTISNGIYYTDDQPIHESSFVYDLKDERTSSNVVELLGTQPDHICVLKPHQPLSTCRFVVGEATEIGEVEEWARRGMADSRILAGAADFFSAFLQAKGFPEKEAPSSYNFLSNNQSKALFVLGSASETSRKNVKKALQQNRAVCSIPPEFFEKVQVTEKLISKWADHIIHSFKNNFRVIAAINKPIVKDPRVSQKLLFYMAKVTENVLSQIDIRDLVIEGGATSAAVIKQLNVKKFIPVHELSPGVVRMKITNANDSLNLTVKPGSYSWPDTIWNL